MTLEGDAKDKIQVIPISGFITDAPKKRVVGGSPSVVQEVVSHLRLAEKDKHTESGIAEDRHPGRQQQRPATFSTTKFSHSRNEPEKK